VMDYGEVVIHLLTPDMREKYALEELWKKAKIVDVEIDTTSPASAIKKEMA
jgi:ribosome-associated protein